MLELTFPHNDIQIIGMYTNKLLQFTQCQNKQVSRVKATKK